MSETRVIYGLIAELNSPVDYDEEIDRISDSTLSLNYNGTLVYMVQEELESYEFGLLISTKQYGDKDKFLALCKEANLDVNPDSTDIFCVQWYDGVDCPLDCTSIEEYRAYRTGAKQYYINTTL